LVNLVDVTKLPAPGTAAIRPATTPPADLGSQSPANVAAIADRADIRPLDIPAALQILLAEVRASFDFQAVLMVGGGVVFDNPAQAARVLVEMVVQAMPDDVAGVASWSAALAHVETLLQVGIERAINAVTAWHDVPAAVVDAAKETRTLVLSVLGDETPNPIWLRPEWAGLAPRFERFRRRRRIARRYLTDPDHSPRSFDDDNEQRA
jgi:hypothetical protein